MDDASSTEQLESPGADEADCDASTGRHGSLPADTRVDVLERDRFRCRVCGRAGPQAGGVATLHVHHIASDPEGIDADDPKNLTTLCRICHNWVHQRSAPAELPVEVTAADEEVLLQQDIEIVRYLAANGPARTGAVAAALPGDPSVTMVRERLAALMGLDNQVAARDRQLIDQDVETGEWGLPDQIEHSARGHIPSDPQTLIQRVEDEQVRRALERGCDRQAVMDVLDVSRRTTFYKEKRARAYDFPLDVFRRGGDGGQHPGASPASDAPDEPELETESEAASESSGADQQELPTGDGDADAGDADDGDAGESADEVRTGPDAAMAAATDESAVEVTGTDPDVRQEVQTAITALQRLAGELE